MLNTDRISRSLWCGSHPSMKPNRKRGKQLPHKYNAYTTLEFEVQPGGSKSADFELKVP